MIEMESEKKWEEVNEHLFGEPCCEDHEWWKWALKHAKLTKECVKLTKDAISLGRSRISASRRRMWNGLNGLQLTN